MKLISWNVNGFRASLKKGFMDYFNEVDADIFCIQETKMQKGQAETDFGGYTECWDSAERKGYSGTATFSKAEPESVQYGIGVAEHDTEGRVITTQYDDFYLVNVYSPNSGRELARLDYRMEWQDAFLSYLKALDEKKPLIICGDLNVARTETDLKNPKTNERSAGYTIEEREKMEALLEAGFIDTFRMLYPEKTGAYTYWSYMFNARKNNAGWRIDYFLVSERIKSWVKESFIDSEIYGSDHCPVGLILEK